MARSNKHPQSARIGLALCSFVLCSFVGSSFAQSIASGSVEQTPIRSQSEQAQLCDDSVEEGAESSEQQSFCLHRRKGLAFYDTQHYREAISELTLAYRIYPAPRILYKIGHAHRKLGELREARQFLSMFLSVDATIPQEQRKRVEESIHALEQQIRELDGITPGRPRWRLGVGAGLNGLGAVLLGFGIPALAVDGACVHGPAIPGSQCPELFQTTAIGRGLVIPGALLLVAGTLTAAWPVTNRTERTAASPQNVTRKE